MRFLSVATLLLVLGGLLFIAVFSSQNPTDKNVLGKMIPGVGGGPGLQKEIVPVSQNPGLYIGREVTIDGEIERVLGNDVLVIKEQGFNDSEVIYVVPTTPPQETPKTSFEPRHSVRVTGIVKVLNKYEIEVESGRKITEENETLMIPRTVILATNILKLDHAQSE